MSHVISNRGYWDSLADTYARQARARWSASEPTWGIFGVGQDVAPPDLAGLDVVELGCGTGYVSSWVTRAGGRPVGLDNSARQLATARAMRREFGLPFPLIQADAERPPLADARFDLAISEYGASIWCDPYRWVPQAARAAAPRRPVGVPAQLDFVTAEWGRRWPVEEVWLARKRRTPAVR
jgi:ubiquinone/menaquinone biosynthesis C-methylase UbiE